MAYPTGVEPAIFWSIARIMCSSLFVKKKAKNKRHIIADFLCFIIETFCQHIPPAAGENRKRLSLCREHSEYDAKVNRGFAEVISERASAVVVAHNDQHQSGCWLAEKKASAVGNASVLA